MPREVRDTEFAAHIRWDGKVQTVQEHCEHTGIYASQALRGIGLEKTAYLAGILHDMGKFTGEFDRYIRAAARGEPVVRGSVNHTFAGVRYLLSECHDAEAPADWKDYAAEFAAYAIGAHHGLFDCVDDRHRSGFLHRLCEPLETYEEAAGNFRSGYMADARIRGLLDQSAEEIRTALEEKCVPLCMDEKQYETEITFYAGLLSRLIASAVIQGDRKDTAEFMGGKSFCTGISSVDWRQILERMERRLSQFPNRTPIDAARGQISAQCRAFAERPGGIYRLNVPTGAGKTLSSLRYALAHAAAHHKSRIIYTAPLLTILEQNAAVIRDYVGDDSLILEHHSNVIREDEGKEELDRMELLAEEWSAPVMITTMVQLLNTFYSGKTTCVRRFQALCGSVILIDEVQTVPNRLLSLFNLTVNFLSAVCGATVILCSATHPCLEKIEHPLAGKIEDIVPYDEKLWEPFHRTDLFDEGPLPLAEIPERIRGHLGECESLLVVCNKKSEAEYLYRELEPEVNCFHLSAAMCPQHRRETLQQIRAALKEKRKKVLCVSTQVIEAGVDISFERVIRFTAGLDSIVQTAGRCNRNGESETPAPACIVTCMDEQLGKLQEIERAKGASLDLLAAYPEDPERFRNDLSSEEAVEFYYRRLFAGMPEHYRDYVVPQNGKTLLDLLGRNTANANDLMEGSGRFFLNQAFREAGDAFEVFDENTTGVIVPYQRGKEIIALFASAEPGFEETKQLLQEAKQYTVSLYSYQRDRLLREQGIYEILEGDVLALKEEYYDSELGLVLKPKPMNYLEV